MSRLSELANVAAETFSDAFETTREAYDGASRFARLRLLVLGVFGLDVIAVILFMAMSGGRPLDLEVWFQPGFPSNMLVFRNEGGEPLKDVHLVLDGKFSLQVLSLPTGLRGFEVSREFRDATDMAPDEGYRPRLVRVTTSDEAVDIRIESRSSQ